MRWKPAGFHLPLQPAQIGQYIGGMLVTRVASLLNDALEFSVNFRIQPHRRNRCFVQNRFENGSRSLAAKRQRVCHHFVEDDAK